MGDVGGVWLSKQGSQGWLSRALRVKPFPCRSTSSSFAVCADFFFFYGWYWASAGFYCLTSVVLVVVHVVITCFSCSYLLKSGTEGDSFCKVQLRSILLLLWGNLITPVCVIDWRSPCILAFLLYSWKHFEQEGGMKSSFKRRRWFMSCI